MRCSLVALILSLSRPSWQRDHYHHDSFRSEAQEGEVLFATGGRVGGGNYTYYTLQDESPVRLVLNTINGDADLYVSESIGKPSFELSEHSSSSATCGRDEVDLPRSVSRPVHVAVYGHPRFEVSSYALEVVAMRDEDDIFRRFTLADDDDDGGEGERGDHHHRQHEGRQGSRSRKRDQDDFRDGGDEPITLSGILWDIIRSILHILVEILL